MTKDETRHWLEIELKTWEDECKSEHSIKEALRNAIKALEENTVSEETYTEEYNRRKDAELELYKLKQEKTCYNYNEDYVDCDQFVCSECGIELQDWHKVERDDDDGEISYHEYTFQYCPHCGRKIKSSIFRGDEEE
jgi:DNA-directed RNA polymerase subunit RPC12/RpoP